MCPVVNQSSMSHLGQLAVTSLENSAEVHPSLTISDCDGFNYTFLYEYYPTQNYVPLGFMRK